MNITLPPSDAEVLFFDPLSRVFPEKAGLIIDASLAFFDKAKIGDKLYSEATLRTEIARARRKALTDAAQAAGPDDSYQDEWFKAKADAVKRIRALLVDPAEYDNAGKAERHNAAVLADEHDAWACEHCNGDGWTWQPRQVAERQSDVQEFKIDCDACNSTGWQGPDAEKAAAGAKPSHP